MTLTFVKHHSGYRFMPEVMKSEVRYSAEDCDLVKPCGNGVGVAEFFKQAAVSCRSQLS
jgi:hypothetical protein